MVDNAEEHLDFRFGEIQTVQNDDMYEGAYEVTPASAAQTLEMTGKTMREDVTVLAIPYFETSNESGTTVYIGGSVKKWHRSSTTR